MVELEADSKGNISSSQLSGALLGLAFKTLGVSYSDRSLLRPRAAGLDPRDSCEGRERIQGSEGTRGIRCLNYFAV